MANHSGYYGGSYYPGSEEGVGGNNGNNDYPPPNPSDINANLQIPHHSMQPDNGFQSAWFGNMYMGQIYSRPPSQEAIYNGHGHYMPPFSPEEGSAVPSAINMPQMMAPQSSHSPSPSALTNGHDHHSPPTYYSPYLGLGTMPGAAEGVSGCPPDADTSNHNISNDSANMAMQALTLSSARGPIEENGIQHDDRPSVEWTRRRFQPADTQPVEISGAAEAVEIKQEVSDQSWRSGSGNSPLREEHEARENNWKAAGKTRTKDKYRVVYSDHQRVELEREFHFSRYITIRRKTELAAQLGLSERQVKIWFQNRRAKERKQTKKREDKMETHMSYHNGQTIHSISNHHHHHHHHQHLSHSLTGPPPAHIPLTPFMMDVKPNLGLD